MEDKTNDRDLLFKELEEKFSVELKDRLMEMEAAANFATFVRLYYKERPQEYAKVWKLHGNDYGRMCCSIVNTLNRMMLVIPTDNPKWTEQKTLLDYQMARLGKLSSGEPSESALKEIKDIQAEVARIQKKMKSLPPTKEMDRSYKGWDLSNLIEKVKTELMTVVPDAEPSDIDTRRTVKFEKKMPLSTALFTLLWNTRPQTIPLSVLNLKGWSARFVQRLRDGEKQRSNYPTVLVMRSRTDNGLVKGSSGKSRICYSCLHLLKKKGLNVSDEGVSISIPTYERVDKEMSDKTMLLMDDINFDNAYWEEFNRFCDGLYIKNRGKYLKEGYILPFGNVLATTNYDIPYKNNENRYPTIEFTPNDSSVVCKHPLVVENARIQYHPKEDRYDFDDAWETLFAYAEENYVKWLEEFKTLRGIVVPKCSKQTTRLENLVMAYIANFSSDWGKSSVCEVVEGDATFSPGSVVEWLKRTYPNEVKNPKVDSVVNALKHIGAEQTNKNSNPYRAI